MNDPGVWVTDMDIFTGGMCCDRTWLSFDQFDQLMDELSK